jgi:hypothetical protein
MAPLRQLNRDEREGLEAQIGQRLTVEQAQCRGADGLTDERGQERH